MILGTVLMCFSDIFAVRHFGSEITKNACFSMQQGKYTQTACT